MSDQNLSYNGNPRVKRDGIEQSWNTEQVQEYIKCSSDPIYFIEKYIKVIHLDRGLVPFNLYDYQKKMIKNFEENNYNVVLSCRQSGKTISVIAYIVWYSCFNSDKTIFLLANKGDTARDVLFARFTLALENLPFFLQPGTKVLNKGSVEFSNNTKVFARATSSSSIRGSSANCVVGETKVCVLDDEENIKEMTIEDLYSNECIKKYDNEKKVENMETENKYKKWYYQLINKARNRKPIDNVYYENHHIIPRSLGGTDCKENLIQLTLREHFVCHKLLVKMHRGREKHKMLHALFMMSTTRKLTLSSRLYKQSKKAAMDSFIRKTFTDEEKQQLSILAKKRWENNEFRKRILEGWEKTERSKKISIALQGKQRSKEIVDRINKDPEKIRKTAEKHRGMKRSESTKENMSKSKKELIEKVGEEEFARIIGKGKIYIHNVETKEIKRVNKDFEIKYPWKKGSGKKHNQKTKYMYRPEVDTKSIRVPESKVQKYLDDGYIFGFMRKK